MQPGYGFEHYPPHIAKDVDIPTISVPQMIEVSSQKYANHVAMSFYGHQTTYAELARGVQTFASALQAAGLEKGDRIAIMLPNCPQYVVAFHGTLHAGAIVTQVNPMSVERELAHILVDSGAKAIVILDALLPRLRAVQQETDIEQVVVVSLQPSDATFEAAETFDAFLKSGASRSVDTVVIDPANDVAVLQYTGGTTGRSKGAMLTHRNLIANVRQCYEFFQDSYHLGRDKCLTVLPLFHVFGMTVCMNETFYTGGMLILLPKFDVQEVAETIKREQPTVFPGVPTMYVALTHLPNIESYGLNSIRVCNSGGSPMPVELMREFERKTGSKVLEGYGLSEASPITHCNPTFAERKPGSIGLPYPSTEYKLVDLDTGTTEVPVGEIGELAIRGPQVMKGYWHMPEETARTLRDGWLYTGDIARLDETGYVSIVDRKKDLIIASGYNIYPREIEEVLYEHPAVQEAIIIGVPDDYRGETVKAYVVLKPGIEASVEELAAYCKANMAPYKVPKLFEFRHQLPKSSVGKLLRRELQKEAQQAPTFGS